MIFRDAIRHGSQGRAARWGLATLVFSCRILAHAVFLPASPALQLLMALDAAFMAAAWSWCSQWPWRWSADRQPRAPLPRGLFQALLAGVLLAGVSAALQSGAIRAAAFHTGQLQLNWWMDPEGATRQATALSLPAASLLLLLLFWVPLYMLTGLMFTLDAEARQQRERLEEENRLARWRLLRAQLNPHVLYNALNALAETVGEESRRGEQAVLDLADLFERMMLHGEKDLAPLGEERRLLESYLAMERLRLGGRLRVRWEWEEGLDALEAPPLLLQPLVENAIKHGIASRPGAGEVLIRGGRQQGEIRLEVHSPGPLGAPSGGVGLDNLRQRLRLTYGDRGRLEVAGAAESVRACVAFPEQRP